MSGSEEEIDTTGSEAVESDDDGNPMFAAETLQKGGGENGKQRELSDDE